jgi:hypothetical protein
VNTYDIVSKVIDGALYVWWVPLVVVLVYRANKKAKRKSADYDRWWREQGRYLH